MADNTLISLPSADTLLIAFRIGGLWLEITGSSPVLSHHRKLKVLRD
jgi:hypothetical protein